MTLVVRAARKVHSAEVEVVNHNTVKLNRARVPGGWERGSHEDNTEGWFHWPWPWIHPPTRHGVAQVGWVRSTAECTRARCVCGMSSPPPLPLEINIALCSCSQQKLRRAYGPVHSIPATFWLVSEKSIRSLSRIMSHYRFESNNFTGTTNQRSAGWKSEVAPIRR